MLKIITCLILTLVTLSCGEKKETIKLVDEDKSILEKTLAVGKVEVVDVSSTGIGLTLSAAFNDAFKLAITQVNGTVVDASSETLSLAIKSVTKIDLEKKDGLDVTSATEVVQSNAFAEKIVSQSKGSISSFKVVKVNLPKTNGGSYAVEINARIAKFIKPIDAGKIRIVLAPLKSNQKTFNIGGRQLDTSEVLEPIRQQIIDSLTQSGRFTVLDRQNDSQIQNELELIASGKTNLDDMAKLSQALSADIIWVGSVNALSYDRFVKKLHASDREVVSYSGNWSINQRLLNLTTRQIILSNTFKGDFPLVAPTTLGASINEKTTLNNVQSEVVKKAIESIMGNIFPISIISLEGETVVLSQGEGSLLEGSRYKVVKLGKEMNDPQTGQSLGKIESDCCEVLVSRVAQKMSYGQLENIKVKLEGIDPKTLQLRGMVTQKPILNQSAQSDTQSKPKINKQLDKSNNVNILPEIKKDKDW